MAGSIAALAAHLKRNDTLALRDLAYTLNFRRSKFTFRKSFSATTVEGLRSKLDASLESNDGSARVALLPASSQVLGIFTGQGAQWASMGRELIMSSSFVRGTVERLEGVLAKLPESDRPKWSLLQELLADSSISRLSEAEISQPLCTVVQIVLVDLLCSAGIRFNAVVGHSSGEMGAAYAAGYLSAEDALRIAYYRGLHSKTACGPTGAKGAMMAVGTTLEDAKELCEVEDLKGRISVAACNSSSSVTLSGDADAIEEAMAVFQDEGKFVRKLRVDTAYHSHHMLPCSKPYIKSLEACKIQIPPSAGSACSWFSSVTGKEVGLDDDTLKSTYWSDNMTSPVMFAQALETAILSKRSFGIAFEVGPHPTLRGPTLQTVQGISGSPIPYSGALERGKNDIEAFADALGFMWAHFAENVVDFGKFDNLMSGGAPAKLLRALPSYAWEHDRVYWLESRLSKAIRLRDQPVHELLGTIFPDGTEHELRWRNLLSPKEVPWLNGHKLQGQTVFPAAGYVSMAVEASRILAGDRSIKLIEMHDLEISRAMVFNSDSSTVETLFTLTVDSEGASLVEEVQASFHLDASMSQDSNGLAPFFRGRLTMSFGEASPDSLPPRAPPLVDTVDVDTDHFYSSLTDLGYEYLGPFRALSSMRRTMDAGTGLITNPSIDDPTRALLVHPSMLDCAIQAVILAYCWPGDNRLWSIHVPTRINRIRLIPSLLKPKTGPEILLPVDSLVGDSPTSGISGDVDIYSEDGRNAMIQIEAIEVAPFTPPTRETDAKLFFEIRWGTASPNGTLMAKGVRASPRDFELATLYERVSYFYLRTLAETISAEELATSEWHFKQLMKFAHHYIAKIEDGTQPFTDKAWKHDTRGQIYEMMEK